MIRWLVVVAVGLGLVSTADHPTALSAQEGRPLAVTYSLNTNTATALTSLLSANAARTGVLEKLNRTDREHLSTLDSLVTPDVWLDDELQYSPFPARYEAASSHAKLFVVHLPAQAWSAYVHGRQVRWGPVSSGRRAHPTPAGTFFLNWKSPGRASTLNPDWFMRWYFNFHNARGLSLHEHPLPGYPASWACVRLLERDATWLYEWGEPWTLDDQQQQVVRRGTPVVIVGQYDHDGPPPWRSTDWLARGITDLPRVLSVSRSP